MKIIWTPKANLQLEQALDYIQQDSPANAQKVFSAIISFIEKAAQQPERFPVDKYKKQNDSSWRAFEKYHYRISYRITKTAIHVIRICHTRQSPRYY